METPQQPQYQPPVMPQSTHKAWVVPLVIFLVLAGGYFTKAKYQSLWPFSSQVTVESPTPTTSFSPSQIILNGGETATLSRDLTITFDRVSSDSRCPSGVTCVWAGEATVVVTLRLNGNVLGTASLSTQQNKNTAKVGGYEITLVNLAPYPKKGSDIKASEYRATLLVVKL